MNLVLSIFPGIGLLDMAFEEEGFCVVRGPDLLWGGDIKRFHPPAGVFDGVIGGPPCKAFSLLANINAAQGRALAEDLIPEFTRVVSEASPAWFLMENVARAPLPAADGFAIWSAVLNNRWFGAPQNRERRFSFGTRDGRPLHVETEVFESAECEPAVTSTSGGRRAVLVRDQNGRVRGKQGSADHHRLQGRSIGKMCELQGLPAVYLDAAPFTASGKREVLGNGVPLPMGRALARAVRKALVSEERAA